MRTNGRVMTIPPPVLIVTVFALAPIGSRGAAEPRMATLRNGLSFLDMQAFYRLPATGIIIVAMLIDRATRGKQGVRHG